MMRPNLPARAAVRQLKTRTIHWIIVAFAAMELGFHSRPADVSAQRITAELKRFLTRGKVQGVRIAEGAIPPPQLAYMVNFPRLSLTLSGEDRTEIEQDGRLRTFSFKPGHALFVPSNTWNRP